MKILALDPATNCGFAYHAGSGVISGTWDLSSRRDESAGMKLIRLRSKLEEFRVGLDLVVFEAARNAMPKMQGALVHQAKLQGVIELWCTEHGIDYRGYSPTEIKKHATGKGNANKAAMIAAARERFGYEGKDDNEADAIWLLDLARSEYDAERRSA
jgi:Holliday junction resolvasome RuvABC endonuclease subunit